MRVSEPFDPDGVTWTAVSRRLAVGRRLVAVVPALLVAGAVFGAGWWLDWRPLEWLALAPVVLAAWEWWLIGRQVRAWAYAERDDDLLVRHGIMLRSLVVVPYGRMQFVHVEAGPLDRILGVARVQLHTASAHTDASIPGVPAAEAARLRDRLSSRGEARLAGL